MPNADAFLQKTKPQQVVSYHSDCPLPLAWLTAPRLGSSVSCRLSLVARACSKAPILTLHSSARLLCPPAVPHSTCLQATSQHAHPRKPLGPLKFILHMRTRRLQHMFIAVLFPVAKRWKQPTCLSMDAWIHKI